MIFSDLLYLLWQNRLTGSVVACVHIFPDLTVAYD